MAKKRKAAVKVVANPCESVATAAPEVKSFMKECPPHEAWLKKKNKIEQAKKWRHLSDQEAAEIDKKTQKKISIEMYQKWLAQSKLRNKPVPFGQGLLSTPTIYTGIFINSDTRKIFICRLEELHCFHIHEYKWMDKSIETEQKSSSVQFFFWKDNILFVSKIQNEFRVWNMYNNLTKFFFNFFFFLIFREEQYFLWQREQYFIEVDMKCEWHTHTRIQSERKWANKTSDVR